MNWGLPPTFSPQQLFSLSFPEFLPSIIIKKKLILLKPQGPHIIAVTSEAIILIVSQKLITKKWTL